MQVCSRGPVRRLWGGECPARAATGLKRKGWMWETAVRKRTRSLGSVSSYDQLRWMVSQNK